MDSQESEGGIRVGVDEMKYITNGGSVLGHTQPVEIPWSLAKHDSVHLRKFTE